MQQQKLCLKWNNHTINLLSVLETFQSKDILVDVTLSCEGRNIKAHKMVLSACSPYFQNIFLENPCQHPIVIINGMKFEDITAILNFMYKGEVNVSHEGLSSFLQAAEALKVKGLAEVCGEKKGSNSNSIETEPIEQSRPQRIDTPNKKRHRNRKRSFSDSNRSDDEGAPRKIKEVNSPEVHELSGDESFTGDMSSNGQQLNSLTPRNVYSRSHQSSSNITTEDMDDEYEVEPSKMLEQTLTENANNSTSSDNGLRIERIVGNASEMESSSLQEPESPPDIKPIIEYGESSTVPLDGNMMVYNEQSQPGPSNIQDGSLLHDNSHTQGKKKYTMSNMENLNLLERISNFEWQEQITKMLEEVNKTLKEHSVLLKSNVPERQRNTSDVMPKLPVNRIQELEMWENFLESPNSYRSAVNYFSPQVSLDARKSTKRLLSAIITQSLAQNFDWIGTKPKRSFKKLKTVSLILSCFKQNPTTSNVSPEIILNYIKDYLKHAEFQDMVLKKLNHLCNHINIFKRIAEPSSTTLVLDNDCMKMFPIATEEQISDLEKLLSSEQNLLNLALTLRGIGGQDEYHVVSNILKRVLTNGVAELYSWSGLKGKKVFKKLNLAKLILETVRLHFPSVTEDSVATLIGNWLRHAKQRREREEGRALNMECKEVTEY